MTHVEPERKQHSLPVLSLRQTRTDTIFSVSFNQYFAHQGEFQKGTHSKHKDQLMSPFELIFVTTICRLFLPGEEKRQQINKEELCKTKPGLSVLQIPIKDESSFEG